MVTPITVNDFVQPNVTAGDIEVRGPRLRADAVRSGGFLIARERRPALARIEKSPAVHRLVTTEFSRMGSLPVHEKCWPKGDVSSPELIVLPAIRASEQPQSGCY